MKRTRRNHSAVFKAKVAVAALRGDKTLAELSEQHQVHVNQITQWKAQLLERASEVFATAAELSEAAGPDVKELHAKRGQLAMETMFWPPRTVASPRRGERKTMIDRSAKLPVVRQCELLDLSRYSVYYVPSPVAASDLALRRRIDERHLQHPFAGARMRRAMLRLEGLQVGRRHVSTLMRNMGLEALYRRPHTRRPHPQNPVLPYLLRDLTIDRPNHVWAMAITYLPMHKGFVYLAAVLDGGTRKVLSWGLSNILTTVSAWMLSRRRCVVTAHRKSSIRTRAASSPARNLLI